MAKNKSETLDESLDGYQNPEIEKNLENLKWLIDPELFDKFKKRIELIIWENPWSEGLVVSELWKTQISAENLLADYNRKFRSILDHASNDDLFTDAT